MKTMTSKFPGKCAKCNQSFAAGTLINWDNMTRKTFHANAGECVVVKLPNTANVGNILSYLAGARSRGLKFPKLRVLNPEGQGEWRLFTFRSGKLGVKSDGFIIAVVGVDGSVERGTQRVVDHLNAINVSPLDAAKRYAAISCNCAFCGLPLTDEGSVEVGYGPVCAKHWGLPHKALGSVELKHVSEAPEPEQQPLSPVDELLSEDESQAQADRAAVAAIGLW